MRYEVTLEGAHGNLIMSTYEAPSEDGEFWVTDVEGWYGGVGVENSDAQRKIGHGFLSAPARRSARAITLKGVLSMPGMEAREIAARFISGLVWDGGLGTLAVAADNGLVLTALVRLDGAPKTTLLGDSAVEFEVPLVAPDPFLKSPARVYQLFPADTGTGLRFPLFAPAPSGVLSYGEKPPQAGTIQHKGNADANPIYVVQGDWASGFRITAGDRIIEYPYAIEAANPATIDCGKGTIIIGGSDQTAELTRRQWHTAPANSPFTVAVEALAPSSGWVDVNFSDTYI